VWVVFASLTHCSRPSHEKKFFFCSETIDEDFQKVELTFKDLEQSTKDMENDVKKYKAAVSGTRWSFLRRVLTSAQKTSSSTKSSLELLYKT